MVVVMEEVVVVVGCFIGGAADSDILSGEPKAAAIDLVGKKKKNRIQAGNSSLFKPSSKQASSPPSSRGAKSRKPSHGMV